MRRLLSAVLVVAVHAAAVVGPFVHVHPDEHETSHHAPNAVHVHLSGHTQATRHAPGPAFDHPDPDRATGIQAFVAVAVAAFPIDVADLDSCALAAPVERPAERTLRVVHGHDPPFLSSLPSRGPPSLPVLI